jgi:hypothetical protein
MVLSNKQKAVAAFIITLILGILGALIAFSGIDESVKPLLTLAVSIVTIIGTTLGVYNTTNKPTDDPAAGEVENPDLTTVDTSAPVAPVVAPVTPTAEVTGE